MGPPKTLESTFFARGRGGRGCPSWIGAGAGLLLVACGASPSDVTEPRATSTQAILGGIASASEHDSVVLFDDNGRDEGCSATLIAPNLVLTALHCVVDYNPNDDCGVPLSAPAPASIFTISVGVYANPREPRARGVRIFTPSAGEGLCGADIALVLLDKDVSGVPTASVRFDVPSLNDGATAVGYGDGGGRRERATTILALGPTSATYPTRSGRNVSYSLPANDLTTGESTCFGDSGGPLLDNDGRVIAVASRGIDDRCDDRPAVWTSLGPHQALIRDALNISGHPLQATSPEQRFTSDKSEDSKEPSDSTSAKSKTASDDTKSIASVGCHASRGAGSSFTAESLMLLGLLALRRRGRR